MIKFFFNLHHQQTQWQISMCVTEIYICPDRSQDVGVEQLSDSSSVSSSGKWFMYMSQFHCESPVDSTYVPRCMNPTLLHSRWYVEIIFYQGLTDPGEGFTRCEWRRSGLIRILQCDWVIIFSFLFAPTLQTFLKQANFQLQVTAGALKFDQKIYQI